MSQEANRESSANPWAEDIRRGFDNLVFTTTPPHGMLEMNQHAPFQPPGEAGVEVRNLPKEEDRIPVQLYLHGEAQDVCGFDLAVPHRGELILPTFAMPALEQRCRVWVEAQQAFRDALCIAWLTDRAPTIKALIVFTTDEASLADARAKCAERRGFL